jgi:hypothetical protein
MQAVLAALAAIAGCLATGALLLSVVLPRRLMEQARELEARAAAELATKEAQLRALQAAIEAGAAADLAAVEARRRAAHGADPVDVANDLVGDVVVPSRDGG